RVLLLLIRVERDLLAAAEEVALADRAAELRHAADGPRPAAEQQREAVPRLHVEVGLAVPGVDEARVRLAEQPHRAQVALQLGHLVKRDPIAGLEPDLPPDDARVRR